MDNFNIPIPLIPYILTCKSDNSRKMLDKSHFATFLFHSHPLIEQQDNEKSRNFLEGENKNEVYNRNLK